MWRYHLRCKMNKKIHSNEPDRCNKCCTNKKIRSGQVSGEWLHGNLSLKFCRLERLFNMLHFGGFIQLLLNYKLQSTNYKQATSHKLQITNKEVSFVQILNAFGEEHIMVSFIR